MSRRVVVAGAAIMIAVVMAAPGAEAHRSSFPTRTTITFTDEEAAFPFLTEDPDDTFSGRVSSTGGCVKRRLVSVFKKASGDDTLVGRTRSASDGKWTVVAEDPGDGSYYAKVGPKVIRRTGHIHTCRGKRTKAIEVDDSTGPFPSFP